MYLNNSINFYQHKVLKLQNLFVVAASHAAYFYLVVVAASYAAYHFLAEQGSASRKLRNATTIFYLFLYQHKVLKLTRKLRCRANF
jgi:hypothetical protein